MNRQQIMAGLEKGFFGFWVRNWRISFLAIIFIVLLGGMSLFLIPKESTPDIKFGIISVNTSYTGVSPEDIDSLITMEIYDEIDQVEGVKKITSTSNLGFSNIIIELDTDTDTEVALQEIRDAVDKAQIPEDSNDPRVTEITSDNEVIFSVFLYGDKAVFSEELLRSRATKIQSELENKNGITDINISGGDDYDIEVVINSQKASALGLTTQAISNSIRSYNQNQPLGNFEVNDKTYDFRIDGELTDIQALLNVPISLRNGGFISLREIASLQREWSSDTRRFMGFHQQPGFRYTELVFNKKVGSNIFSVAGSAREGLNELMSRSDLAWLRVEYGLDMEELIKDDYSDLGRNALLTFVLVLLSVWLFVGWKEGVIATMGILLSFLVTFFVLRTMGLSLNFLTNFSLVLTFGIAIDTTIVIIEGAAEKVKVGYTPRNAVLMAIRDYKLPLIAGTATTLVAFLPMMGLPGVLGKFLAYIPITVFATLVAALFLALTINSALFYRFSKTPKFFLARGEDEVYSPEDTVVLEYDRQGRTKVDVDRMSWRQKMLGKMDGWYERTVKQLLDSRKARGLSIWLPIMALVFTFVFVSPRVGFILFPQGDSPYLYFTIEAPVGTTQNVLEEEIVDLDQHLSDMEEIKYYTTKYNGNKVNINVELTKTKIRKTNNLRLSADIEKEILSRLDFYNSQGFVVSSQIEQNGPPTGSAVGIKLVAESTNLLPDLIQISDEFELHLRSIEGSKSVVNSAQKSPGQVVFTVNPEALKTFEIQPTQVYGKIAELLNGSFAGTIQTAGKDHDIKVKYDQFIDAVSTVQILSEIIPTPQGNVAIADLVHYEIRNAITSINREKGDILISIQSDLEEDYLAAQVQGPFVKFSEGYEFPSGISYKKGGENAENQELLIATATSFFTAILLIFLILVLIFNSYSQPLVILYSVVLAMLGVNVGLWITGNSYSMPFGIGFIALTGIVVNDAIILIDKMNQNRKLGMNSIRIVQEAGKSRLQPIILTTLTTIFGVLPLAFQDEFWAALSFTVVFGLFVGSAMTLFVIPALYYNLYLKEKKPQKRQK